MLVKGTPGRIVKLFAYHTIYHYECAVAIRNCLHYCKWSNINELEINVVVHTGIETMSLNNATNKCICLFHIFQRENDIDFTIKIRVRCVCVCVCGAVENGFWCLGNHLCRSSNYLQLYHTANAQLTDTLCGWSMFNNYNNSINVFLT